MDTLDVMKYDGSKRRTILKSGLIKHPFALATFEDYAYFTDWSPGSIRRLSRRDGSSKFIYKDQLTKPMGIQVFHNSKQPIDEETINYCAKAFCTHLCLLKPNGYSCKCPFGYQLKKDDNTSCVSKYQRFFCNTWRSQFQKFCIKYFKTITLGKIANLTSIKANFFNIDIGKLQ